MFQLSSVPTATPVVADAQVSGLKTTAPIASTASTASTTPLLGTVSSPPLEPDNGTGDAMVEEKGAIVDAFEPFEISKIMPPIRRYTLAEDCILKRPLPTPKCVTCWANASSHPTFDVQAIVAMEKDIATNKSIEKNKKIKIVSVEYGVETVEYKRVKISLLQRQSHVFVPMVAVYLTWKDMYNTFLCCSKLCAVFCTVFFSLSKVVCL
jgi:hypothetical protein